MSQGRFGRSSTQGQEEGRERFGFPCRYGGCSKFLYGATKKQAEINREAHWETDHGVCGIPCKGLYCSRIIFGGDLEEARTLRDRHLDADHYCIPCGEDPGRCRKVIFGINEDEAAIAFDDHLEQDHGVEFEDDEEFETATV